MATQQQQTKLATGNKQLQHAAVNVSAMSEVDGVDFLLVRKLSAETATALTRLSHWLGDFQSPDGVTSYPASNASDALRILADRIDMVSKWQHDYPDVGVEWMEGL